MSKAQLKSVVIASLWMVIFGALLNGVLINLLLQSSHLILVEQLSNQLLDFVLLLVLSLAVLLLFGDRHPHQLQQLEE